jgi:hypothetical protein
LAARLEEHVKQKRPERRADEETSCCIEVSDRVREIARSTLHLSDLEIDELFFNTQSLQQDTASEYSLVQDVEEHLDKLPFANSLVQRFTRIFS